MGFSKFLSNTMRSIFYYNKSACGMPKVFSNKPNLNTSFEESATPFKISTNHLSDNKNNAPYKDFKEIPGPFSLPIFGTLWTYLPFLGEYSFKTLHLNCIKRYEKYGAITREEIVPGVHIIYLSDPDDVETLLRSSGKFPERRSHVALLKYRKDKPDIYNSGGLLPTNKEEWWQIRSLFQKSLSSPQKASVYIEVTDAIVNDFIERVSQVHCGRKSARDDTDFLEDLTRLNLQLLCIIAFDVRIASFSPEEMMPDSMSTKLIDAAYTANSCIIQTDNTPEALWGISSVYTRFCLAQEYLEKVALEFIGKKIKFYKENENSTERIEKEQSLLESYLSNSNIDLKELVGMSTDLLLAGIDTTSYTTSFALYHLANNLEVQQKLFEESIELLPNPTDVVTAEVLSKAFYLKAFLKESLRVNPVSVGIGRVVTEDIVLSGYRIPKGTTAVTNNQLISSLPEFFDQPAQFIPERWMRNSDRYKSHHPFASIPFGHGSRMCIARRLAEQNMHITLFKLVRHFEIGWVGKKLEIVSVAVNKPDGRVTVTFNKRNTSR